MKFITKNFGYTFFPSFIYFFLLPLNDFLRHNRWYLLCSSMTSPLFLVGLVRDPAQKRIFSLALPLILRNLQGVSAPSVPVWDWEGTACTESAHARTMLIFGPGISLLSVLLALFFVETNKGNFVAPFSSDYFAFDIFCQWNPFLSKKNIHPLGFHCSRHTFGTVYLRSVQEIGKS